MKESDLERTFNDTCYQLGLLQAKLNIRGRRGWTDRILLHRSVAAFVELKAPGKALTPMQQHVHETLRHAGFEVRKVDDKDELLELLTRFHARCKL